MTFKDYIKQLTIQERQLLAADIDCSLGYLNRQVVTNQPLAGNRLVYAVLNSEFNCKNLPPKRRFKMKHYKAHKALKEGKA